MTLVSSFLFFYAQPVSPSAWKPSVQQLSPRVHAAIPLKRIALTFDDGPHPGKTESLLALLAREQTPATFFVVGKMAQQSPRLVQRISAEGHEVTNHTFHHFRLNGLPAAQAMDELWQTRHLIRQLTGVDTPYFRPPGGMYSLPLAQQAENQGFRMVLWSTQTKDIAGVSAEEIHRRILAGAEDGAIVLMHSGLPNTLAALPGAIAELKARGFTFVTVSSLLETAAPPAASFQ